MCATLTNARVIIDHILYFPNASGLISSSISSKDSEPASSHSLMQGGWPLPCSIFPDISITPVDTKIEASVLSAIAMASLGLESMQRSTPLLSFMNILA